MSQPSSTFLAFSGQLAIFAFRRRFFPPPARESEKKKNHHNIEADGTRVVSTMSEGRELGKLNKHFFPSNYSLRHVPRLFGVRWKKLFHLIFMRPYAQKVKNKLKAWMMAVYTIHKKRRKDSKESEIRRHQHTHTHTQATSKPAEPM